MTRAQISRFLSPQTNPGLYTALASLGISLWQAFQVQSAAGPLTWNQVGRVAFPIVVAALAGYWQRSKTSPVKDPKDANGNPLITEAVHLAALLEASRVTTPAELPRRAKAGAPAPPSQM